MYAILRLLAPLVLFSAASDYIYPPLAVVLFVFACPYDTVGIAALVPRYLAMCVWPIFIVATGKALLKLNRDHSGPHKWPWVFGCLAVAGICLILLSRLLNSPSDIASIEIVERLMAVIVALAYFDERRAQLLFFSTLVVQLLLALALTLRPEGRLHLLIPDLDTTNLAHLMKAEENSEGVAGVRFGAQFGETVNVAFYAAVAVATGIWGGIFGGMKRWLRVGSLVLIPIGAYLLGVSTTRGVTLGLLFGVVVFLTQARGLIAMSLMTIASGAMGGWMFYYLQTSDAPEWTRAFEERFEDLQGSALVQSEAYRIQGIKVTKVALEKVPLLGFGGVERAIEAQGNLAHIGPLSDISTYGVPFALITTLFLLCGVGADVFALRGEGGEGSRNCWQKPQGLSGMFGWIVLATAVTNSYPIPAFGSVVLVVAMVPLIQWLDGKRAPAVARLKQRQVANDS
jgi:hypothetical protein